MVKTRIDWIDAAKGVGILLVVLGHVRNRFDESFLGLTSWAVFLFHMPLFFLLSGLTHSPKAPDVTARRKWTLLMVPYLSFFGLIAAYSLTITVLQSEDLAATAERLLRGLLKGGRDLTGNFGVFWFVPVLVLACILHDLLGRLGQGAGVARAAVALLGVGTAPAVSHLVGQHHIPFLANAVPIAFFYFWMGTALRPLMERTRLLGGLAAGVVLVALVASLSGVGFSMNIKAGNFGPFLIGPALAVALSVLLMLGVRAIPNGALAWLGRRSLTVMFLHMPLLFLAWYFQLPVWAGILLAVALPLAFHEVTALHPLGRRCFHGVPGPDGRSSAQPSRIIAAE